MKVISASGGLESENGVIHKSTKVIHNVKLCKIVETIGDFFVSYIS